MKNPLNRLFGREQKKPDLEVLNGLVQASLQTMIVQCEQQSNEVLRSITSRRSPKEKFSLETLALAQKIEDDLYTSFRQKQGYDLPMGGAEFVEKMREARRQEFAALIRMQAEITSLRKDLQTLTTFSNSGGDLSEPETINTPGSYRERNPLDSESDESAKSLPPMTLAEKIGAVEKDFWMAESVFGSSVKVYFKQDRMRYQP